MSIWLIFGYILSVIMSCLSLDDNSGGTAALAKTIIEAPNYGEKMVVSVGMLVQSIGNIDTRKMSVDVDFYLHMSWTDPRLRHDRPKPIVISGYKSLEKMWLPDLYIVNSKESNFHTVTRPNFAIWVMSTGQVAYSVRVTSSVSCPLNLIEYPLDEQICEIKLMSYAYAAEELELKWFKNDAVKLNEKIELPEFEISYHALFNCNYDYSYGQTANSTLIGEFSCLNLMILFRRAITYHLIQTFLPTALIVGISWISFWLDRNAVPARVTLSFTTLLTLSTMAAGVRFSLPPVSYAKAIDIWMGACTFLVFAALLEFAVVNNYNQRAKKCEHKAEKLEISNNEGTVSKNTPTGDTVVDMGCSLAILKEERNEMIRKAQRVDNVSKVLFPVSFLIFNMFFWLVCFNILPILESYHTRMPSGGLI